MAAVSPNSSPLLAPTTTRASTSNTATANTTSGGPSNRTSAAAAVAAAGHPTSTSLFVGPPSANSSNLDLPPTSTQPPARVPLLRSRSTRAGPPTSVPDGGGGPTSAPSNIYSNDSLNVPAGSTSTSPSAAAAAAAGTAGVGTAGLGRSSRANPTGAAAAAAAAPGTTADAGIDRTDALWAEMQATLAEVEISALGSEHVFGAAHSKALEELREAQIALAVAWGRGEADEEETEKGEKSGSKAGTGGEGSKQRERDGDGEEDEEADIREARRRREANEKFFKRVGEGVVDVVGKLEGVAQAMAKVEKESREIWRGSDSVDSASVAS